MHFVPSMHAMGPNMQIPNLEVSLNTKFKVSPELCLEQLVLAKVNSNKVPWNAMILAKLA